jgi:hypothetical protein
MNIWMPTENIELIRYISIVCGVMSILSLIVAYYTHHREKMIQWLISMMVFVLGFAGAMTPWLIKNGVEAHVGTVNQI